MSDVRCKMKVIYLLLNRFIVITLQQKFLYFILASLVNMTKLETMSFDIENASHNLLSKFEFSSLLYVESNSPPWLII